MTKITIINEDDLNSGHGILEVTIGNERHILTPGKWVQIETMEGEILKVTNVKIPKPEPGLDLPPGWVGDNGTLQDGSAVDELKSYREQDDGTFKVVE